MPPIEPEKYFLNFNKNRLDFVSFTEDMFKNRLFGLPVITFFLMDRSPPRQKLNPHEVDPHQSELLQHQKNMFFVQSGANQIFTNCVLLQMPRCRSFN